LERAVCLEGAEAKEEAGTTGWRLRAGEYPERAELVA
jgi:hypothetical protein